MAEEKESRVQFMLGELCQGLKSLENKVDQYMDQSNKRLDKHEDEINVLGKQEVKISTKVGGITGFIGIVTGGIGSFLMELFLRRTP